MRPVLIAVGGEPAVLAHGVEVLRALLAAAPSGGLPQRARADANATLDSLERALRRDEALPAASAEELAAQVRAADAPDPSPRCAAPWCRRYVPRAGAYCMAHAGQLDAGEGAP